MTSLRTPLPAETHPAPTTPPAGAAPAGDLPLAIETHGLRKEYGRKVAVANLSLRVPAGQVFGFLGPNGAGKSTTVKMLTGLVRPTAGRGSLLGRPLGDPAARRRLGFLPEQFRFHEWLRAEEFLDLHASLYGLPGRERPRRIAESLALVGLSSRAGDTLGTFSKGMLQRIGIAQAVIADPLLVILDEPTSALDPIGRRDVRDLIRRLRERGIAVFLNSHLLSEVESVCDRVAIIDHGMVVRQGALRDLVAGALEAEVRLDALPPALLIALGERWPAVPSAAPDGAGCWTVRLTLQDDADLPRVADLVLRHGAGLHALIPRRTTLEDLFVQSVENHDV
ncbi:MAG TPA: ABC transporter ATP-binding protein [Chloroflexota bacterium]|jgi:ABC-2 type transport system ATP-binding protein|nr:ABC transporter ATP-binding protein [Chloroflexota bacterium]